MSKERKIGIDLLRIIMCVTVVFIHYTPHREISSFSILGEYQKIYVLAVPVFFLISFFFLSSKLDNIDLKNNWMLLWNRLKRLGIPHLLWTIVFFFGFMLLWKCGISDKEITIKCFFDQLFFGNSYNHTMWYIIDTMILTIIFIVLYNVFYSHFFSTSIICVIISFCLEYTGVNYLCFGGLSDEYRFALGRIVEMTPYAFGGYICYRIYVDFKIKNTYYLIVPLLILIHYNFALPWLESGPSFYYAGCRYFAEAILTMFVFINIDINYQPIRNVIQVLSPITFGVFIIHFFVGTIIQHYCNLWFPDIDNIYVSIMTVIVSFLICISMTMIPSIKIQKLVR